LPVSDADLDTLYGWLGHREVSILSRGYGNCRITSTRLQNVWWVQYFNSMDALILNSIEIVGMPEVALAADEDFDRFHRTPARIPRHDGGTSLVRWPASQLSQHESLSLRPLALLLILAIALAIAAVRA
jgi:hypothetical protein